MLNLILSLITSVYV